MPDTGITDNSTVFTSSLWDTYVRQQVVAQVTSSTRPTGVEGREINETDTDRELTHDGSAWIRTGWYSSTGRTTVRARRTSAQSIPTGAPTAITFDTEDADTDTMIAVPATTFTVPSGLGGIWAISAQCVMASPITARWWINIPITSTVTGLPTAWRGNAYGDDVATTTYVGPLAAADTFQVTIFQASAGAVNCSTAWVSAIRLGA